MGDNDVVNISNNDWTTVISDPNEYKGMLMDIE